MGVDIRLKPDEAWTFFQGNKERLSKEQVEIASNEDTGTTVCITEEKGLPLFTVYRGCKKIYDEPAVESDCCDTLRDMYIKYLFPIIVSDGANKKKQHEPYEEEEPYDMFCDYVSQGGTVCRAVGGKGPQDLEDSIYERDDELEMAMYDLLLTFLPCSPDEMFGGEAEDVIKDLVDEVCESLACNYGVSVHRPKWVGSDDDDQTLVFTEYPYDELIDEQKDVPPETA